MKSVVIEAFGRPGVLAVVDRPVGTPAAGEVLVAVEAVGVGGVDVVIRSGLLNSYGFQPGFVPGSEVAGVVSAVGPEVDPAWVGRRVWAFTGVGGGYVEHAVVAADQLVALPQGLAPRDAVALGSAGVVAHFGLAHARFAPGESVLVRGAAGSLGIQAVQLAAQGGAGVVAVTTSSSERGERLRALGATHVLDRAGDGPGAPDGFDVIYDVIAGPELPSFLERLAPNGRHVLVGLVGGQPPADFGATLLRTFQQSRSFATFSTDTVPLADRQAVRAAQFTAAARGELDPVVQAVLPLGEAAVAHARMDAGEVFGRIVLEP